jgi:hypothetical protein
MRLRITLREVAHFYFARNKAFSRSRFAKYRLPNMAASALRDQRSRPRRQRFKTTALYVQLASLEGQCRNGQDAYAFITAAGRPPGRFSLLSELHVALRQFDDRSIDVVLREVALILDAARTILGAQLGIAIFVRQASQYFRCALGAVRFSPYQPGCVFCPELSSRSSRREGSL